MLRILKTRNAELKGAYHISLSGHGFPAQVLHEGCEGFLRKPDPSTIQPFDIVPAFSLSRFVIPA